MRKAVMVFIFVFIAAGTILVKSCGEKPVARTGGHASKIWWTAQTDSLLYDLSGLDTALLLKRELPVIKSLFEKARLGYKNSESLVEYFFQGLTKRINGPALPDIRTEDGQVWPPHGFQVIEQYLYGGYHDSLAGVVSAEIRLLQTDLRFIRANIEHISILPYHAREIIQHQLIRIASLGITGFDAPISKFSLPEAAAALEGIRSFVFSYYGNKQEKNWNNSLEQAIDYLRKHDEFDSFDRLEFLSSYLAPLSKQLAQELPIDNGDSLFTKPFRGTLSDLLQGKGINADYYASYANAVSNQRKVELGRKLFFDAGLSSSGNLSCATCHKPELFFTDGRDKAANLVHGGSLGRNTPSLYYASLQSNQFYDLRSVTLEDQAHEVMKNHDEFNFSSSGIAAKLNGDTVYQRLFRQAVTATDSIGGYEVRNALAAFVRSLNPFSSAFDAYLQGDRSAMNTEEKLGFNLFAGKAKCATCHFVPLFNGNIPPWFTKSESEIIGVPSKPIWRNAIIDTDSGRYRINKMDELLFAFKTPSVRNVAMTGPYMHNGVYRTLEEVVEFYHKGGGAGLGMDLPFQSLPFDSLQLNPAEKKAIVAFMHTLTDRKNGY